MKYCDCDCEVVIVSCGPRVLWNALANDIDAAFPVRCCFTLRFQKCLFSALRSGFFPPHIGCNHRRGGSRELHAQSALIFPFTFILKEVACAGDVMVARRLHCGVSGLLADVNDKASQCRLWGWGGGGPQPLTAVYIRPCVIEGAG